MKKLLLVFMIQGMLLSTYAQDEPFVKALRTLKAGSPILDAAMLFKKDYSQFTALAEEPILIANVQSPNDPGKVKKVEAYYLVSYERNQLIQLYYLDNQLYQKAAYWYFEPGQIQEVEDKYAACLAYFKHDPFFIEVNKGFLNSDEQVRRLGRITEFYLDNQKKENLRGECGYQLVYTEDKSPHGVWVYMDGWNTNKLELDPDVTLPEIEVPNGTLTEVGKLLINNKEE